MIVFLKFDATAILANLTESAPVTFVNYFLLHKLLNQIHCLLTLRTYWIRKILILFIYKISYLYTKIYSKYNYLTNKLQIIYRLSVLRLQLVKDEVELLHLRYYLLPFF